MPVVNHEIGWSYLVAVILWASLVFGTTGTGPAAPQATDVVHIVSDRLEAHQQERQVVFSGHVVARQGDLTIQGDSLYVFYLEGDRTGADQDDLTRRVDRIVVEGNVRVSQQDWVATGRHAVYYRLDNKVVLTGEPRVQRDKDIVRGTSITLFLDSQKSIVEGGPSGPVEAYIFSPKPEDALDKDRVEGTGSSGTTRDEVR